MPNITTAELETAALNNLARSDYGAPGEPVWQSEATGGIVTAKAVSGVVSSLSKKGLVRCSGAGSDATITITKDGLAVLGL